MKALVKYADSAGAIGLRDIPEPVCGRKDVKIEIKSAAVCATDIHIEANEYPWAVGVPLGHEFCGVVVEAGPEVSRFQVGERVVSCMDGGFAKYVVKAEDDWVFHLPDEISFDEGALLEPFTAAANSVLNRSNVKAMDKVLIEGPGIIGLSVLQVCKLVGADVMISGTAADAGRLALAKRFGADRIINIEQESLNQAVEVFTKGKGLDIVFECSGNQHALNSGLSALKYDGILVQLGIFGEKAIIDLGDLVYNNKRIIGSIAYDKETWLRTIEMVRSGKAVLSEYISKKLPLDAWETAFELTKSQKALRVIMTP